MSKNTVFKPETVIASDLHLTKNYQDEYRWGLFDQLISLCEKYKTLRHILISGDITDAKGNHSSDLLNRLVDNFQRLKELTGCFITLLAGNHDGISAEVPFFRFMRHLDGFDFVYKPTTVGDQLLLPHTRDPLRDWEGLDFKNKIVIAHVTVDGVFSESMKRLDSEVSADKFNECALAFSGDIHKPQEIGKLIYVGAPYQIRFGDNYDGGCVLLDSKNLKWERHKFDFPKKIVIDISSGDEIDAILKSPELAGAGHQIKLRFHCNQNNLDKWREGVDKARASIQSAGLIYSKLELAKDYNKVAPLAKSDTTTRDKFVDFDSFCVKSAISEELIKFGKDLMDQADKAGV